METEVVEEESESEFDEGMLDLSVEPKPKEPMIVDFTA